MKVLRVEPNLDNLVGAPLPKVSGAGPLSQLEQKLERRGERAAEKEGRELKLKRGPPYLREVSG